MSEEREERSLVQALKSLAEARDELRRALDREKHLIDNLGATQTRCSDLMLTAQTAANYLRACDKADGRPDLLNFQIRDIEFKKLREAVRLVWSGFDRT